MTASSVEVLVILVFSADGFRLAEDVLGWGRQKKMRIAILSAADVSSWYDATLLERGHEIMFGPFRPCSYGSGRLDQGRH